MNVANFGNKNHFWKGIRQIISLKLMASKIPSKLLEGDTELVESKSIANAFNNFFASVGSKMAASVPDLKTHLHIHI